MHALAADGLNNVRLMHEDTKTDANGEKKVGFRTDERNKRFMALQLTESFRLRRIRLYKEFVSVGGVAHTDIQCNMVAQLRFFMRLIFPPKDPTFGKPVEKLTGKFRGKKDDIVMAMMICHLMVWLFLKHIQEFGEYTSGQG